MHPQIQAPKEQRQFQHHRSQHRSGPRSRYVVPVGWPDPDFALRAGPSPLVGQRFDDQHHGSQRCRELPRRTRRFCLQRRGWSPSELGGVRLNGAGHSIEEPKLTLEEGPVRGSFSTLPRYFTECLLSDISTLEKTGHLYFAPTCENGAYFSGAPVRLVAAGNRLSRPDGGERRALWESFNDDA